MSNLISGKEALIALANGDEVEYDRDGVWCAVHHMLIGTMVNDVYKFRIKPRTITINGIEVPASFEPKTGDGVWILNDDSKNGYIPVILQGNIKYKFGAWRTEDEIKQVVSALRSIFRGE